MNKRFTAIIAVVIILILAIASVMGCSGAQKSVEKHAEISAQNFNDGCESPDEVHSVPPFRFPIPAQVIRHKNCMGVPDLLAIAWPGEPTEKNVTAVKLLMLMYIEHQSEPYRAELLKIDTTTADDGLAISVAFYRLEKIVEKNNEDI